jgi:hypothetical protein
VLRLYDPLGLGNGRVLFRIGIVFWIGFGLLMLGFVLGFGADYSAREIQRRDMSDGNSALKSWGSNLDGGRPLTKLWLQYRPSHLNDVSNVTASRH